MTAKPLVVVEILYFTTIFLLHNNYVCQLHIITKAKQRYNYKFDKILMSR